MMQVNNKIVANWLKIANDLQSQLIASEEDKIKLSTEIASLTGEVERLREMPPVQWIQDQIAHQQRIYPMQDWDKIKSMSFDVMVIFRRWLEQSDTRAALQPEEGNP